MNEVEDGFQLGAALQRRAAALLLAHYSTSSRSQRLDLGIEVLIDSRGLIRREDRPGSAV